MAPLVALAVIVAAIVAGWRLASIVAGGVDGQIAALTSLLGGWRTPDWPHGVQEDDPESAWASHSERPNEPQREHLESWIEPLD